MHKAPYVLGLALLAACGGSETPPTAPSTPAAPSFAVSAASGVMTSERYHLVFELGAIQPAFPVTKGESK